MFSMPRTPKYDHHDARDTHSLIITFTVQPKTPQHLFLRHPHPHVLCVCQVSLFNYVFLVSWAFALPFSQFRPLASSVCTVWTCVIIVCKMLYQLTSINPSTYSKTCSMVSRSLALLSTRGTRKRSRSDRVCDSLLQPDNYTDAQRLDMAKSLLYSSPVDPANWIGLRKFSPLLENLRVRAADVRTHSSIRSV